ncbi:MAG TPA: phosphoglucosamine mutase [Rhodobacteraceae bacterium]|nr:phosphoglucosamine mutase [Paracoccaceae bacterium]
MSRKYFGTDGIRGRTNQFPMTADIALRVGMAAAQLFTRGEHRHRVVIGKDTRLSGYMIEAALQAGFTSAGMDVFLLGPMPTPAVAMLTRSLRADIGVMISASHNAYEDNGIKLFGPDGFKLDDETEKRIESLLVPDAPLALVSPVNLGRARRIDSAQGRYIEFAKSTFPRNIALDGLRIVIDSANGAAYEVAPSVLFELGAELIEIGNKPNGFNINRNCGSTSPEALQKKVIERRADIGIALDGDADRVLIVDERGHRVDGDQLMALIASSWNKEGRLSAGGVVATVMSNLGLERYLDNIGLSLSRTDVGDRYVVDYMRKHGYNLGGEQSGHIILSDYATTGDGLIAALQILAVMVRSGKRMSELSHAFEPVPQIIRNVRRDRARPTPLKNKDITKLIEDSKIRLGESGRLVIRPSGTEPLIRVMAEGDDESLINSIVNDIIVAIEQVAA